MTSSTSALVALSDRWRDQVTLRGNVSNLDAVNLLQFTLPPGFGDCLLLEVYVQIESIATIMTMVAGFTPGIRVSLRSSATDVDLVDVAEFFGVDLTAASLTLAAHAIPDELVFWRENENLQLFFGEIDVNATPTADLIVWCRVQKLRISAPAELGEFLLTS